MLNYTRLIRKSHMCEWPVLPVTVLSPRDSCAGQGRSTLATSHAQKYIFRISELMFGSNQGLVGIIEFQQIAMRIFFMKNLD